MAGTWSLAAPARNGVPLVAVAGYERAAGLARFRPVAALDALTGVTLVIDGISLATDAQPGETVGGLLRSAGIEVATGDRLSVPLDRDLVAGLRIVLDRGFPVTVVDGGTPVALRAQPGTVASFLAEAGIALGPYDRLAVAAEGPIVPGAIVGIDRVSESTVVETIPIAAPIETIEEPDQYVGWRYVAVSGANGESRVTFLVRAVNGVETERTIIASEPISAGIPASRLAETVIAPFNEPAILERILESHRGEIAAIIRAAAAKYGVDPEQLLRVAYCESRYDPLAYNSVLGASGLFQIIPGTWRANSVAAGYGGASVFDPVANANVAAYMFSIGQARQWSCK